MPGNRDAAREVAIPASTRHPTDTPSFRGGKIIDLSLRRMGMGEVRLGRSSGVS